MERICLTVPSFFFCFSFLSQGQVEEDKDHSLTDLDLTQGEAKVGTN